MPRLRRWTYISREAKSADEVMAWPIELTGEERKACVNVRTLRKAKGCRTPKFFMRLAGWCGRIGPPPNLLGKQQVFVLLLSSERPL
jgi:hypothetical protein